MGKRRYFLKLAKKNLDKKIYSKLKRIAESDEFSEAAKYILVAKFERDYYELFRKISFFENQERDVFFAKNKLLLIPAKIKHFRAGFKEEDFNKLVSLIDDVKKEIEEI